MQKQFYLRLTKAKASKTKPKTGKAERKREPVPVFRSASYLKTMMSKIRKGESNRADLYAKIAEPHPIFGKDSTNHIQNKTGPVGTWPYFRKINLDISTKTANFRFFRQQKFR